MELTDSGSTAIIHIIQGTKSWRMSGLSGLRGAARVLPEIFHWLPNPGPVSSCAPWFSLVGSVTCRLECVGVYAV